MNKYYKVDWCKHCNQGWIIIQKDGVTGELFLYCTEIENEWDSFNHYKENNGSTHFTHQNYTNPTYLEIKSRGWDKYLLKFGKDEPFEQPEDVDENI